MSRLPLEALFTDDNDLGARDPFDGASAEDLRELEQWMEEQREQRIAAFLALPPCDGPDPPF